MHGSGNDYVYVDCFNERLSEPEQLVKWISDRHKGIGSDGLVLIMPSDKCDFRMRMFNPDGTEAQMCGNASRCVGKYIYDYGLSDKKEINLETKAGIKYLRLFENEKGKIGKVCVDMGEPVLQPVQIPVDLSYLKVDKPVINEEIDFLPEKYKITCVSMGNPHCIIFVNEHPDKIALEMIGKKIENHPLFPERTNVEFVNVISANKAIVRVWERGTGETQACGTGACAVLVAGVLNNVLDRKAIISLPGGDLEIEWDETNNHIYMTGDAVTVYEGELIIE